MWFAVKGAVKELQHNYIMLWLGTEGLRLLNTWNLTAEQLKDPQNIWDKLALIEPPQNFRVPLEFQKTGTPEAETKTRRIDRRLLHTMQNKSSQLSICKQRHC